MEGILDIDLLQQTINIQSCLIEGHSIEAIFRNKAEFFFEQSDAEFAGLSILQKDYLQLEFIIEKGIAFHQLLKRYHLQSHTLVLDSYLKNNRQKLKENQLFLKEKSLLSFLSDSLSKNKICYFEENNQFKEMISLPLFSLENQLIGFIFFCYLGDSKHNSDNLLKIRMMVETIIRPFHDIKTNSFQGKCIQILTDMPLLTSKEKHILKKLMSAKTYAQIADEMHISVNTVKTHIKHIYAKYEVKSKLELSNKVNSGSLI